MGETIINHPFGNGLYHLFLVMTVEWFVIVLPTLLCNYGCFITIYSHSHGNYGKTTIEHRRMIYDIIDIIL